MSEDEIFWRRVQKMQSWQAAGLIHDFGAKTCVGPLRVMDNDKAALAEAQVATAAGRLCYVGSWVQLYHPARRFRADSMLSGEG